MLKRSLQRSAANSWRASSAKYDGRTGLLVAVMISNLTAVTLFGGGIMLLLVTGIEFTYSLVRPESATWFSSEAGSALGRLRRHLLRGIRGAHGPDQHDQPVLPASLQDLRPLTTMAVSQETVPERELMTNPAHTLVINWDADGNLEFKDLVSGLEGTASAGDEVRFIGAGGRTLTIDNASPDAEEAEEDPDSFDTEGV